MTSAMSSISAHAPNGISAPPNVLRACAPRLPRISRKSSDAPFATTCGSVKFGVLFTITSSLTSRFIWSRSPRAACSVASNSMAMSRAACLPSSTLHLQSRTLPLPVGYRLSCGYIRSFGRRSDSIPVRHNSRTNWAREKVQERSNRNSDIGPCYDQVTQR
jgi:hypothetical protein